MRRGRPPTFVCIGAQKAGTQWLYDQAASHPDVWMPPVKELRFFAGPWDRAREIATRRLNLYLRRRWQGEHIDARDLEFLRRLVYETTDESRGDLATYWRLFGVAGPVVTGDVSPNYAALDRAEVTRLVEELTEARFVHLVREPVGRVWSQVCMHVYLELAPPEVVTDPKALADYVRTPAVTDASFQSTAVERWTEIAGDRFAVFSMRDMIATPEEFRRQVFRHLGLDGDLCAIPADHNRKADRPKAELTGALREVIVDYLGDEPAVLESRLAERGLTL